MRSYFSIIVYFLLLFSPKSNQFSSYISPNPHSTFFSPFPISLSSSSLILSIFFSHSESLPHLSLSLSIFPAHISFSSSLSLFVPPSIFFSSFHLPFSSKMVIRLSCPLKLPSLFFSFAPLFLSYYVSLFYLKYMYLFHYFHFHLYFTIFRYLPSISSTSPPSNHCILFSSFLLPSISL